MSMMGFKMKKSILAVLMVLGLSSCKVEAGDSWKPNYNINCAKGDYSDWVDINVEDFTLGDSMIYFKDKDNKKHWVSFGTQCHITEL